MKLFNQIKKGRTTSVKNNQTSYFARFNAIFFIRCALAIRPKIYSTAYILTYQKYSCQAFKTKNRTNVCLFFILKLFKGCRRGKNREDGLTFMREI